MNRGFGLLSLLLSLGLAAGCQEPVGSPVGEASAKSSKKRPKSGPAPRKIPERPMQPEPLIIVESPPHPPSSEKKEEPVPPEPVEPEPTAPPKTVTTTPPVQEIKRKPKRPKDSWVIFREAFEENEDAECTATWLERNRFEIKTKNIQRLTIDMNKRPEGAPEKGPWIFFLDGQGIELTGFKPKKPGYTGRKKDLVRSKNGKWTVDRRKLYRVGG
ncbi:MAG: hypothetical protein MI923_28560 [Phycisphaerales bacterium]|nr:hypothetical protein [Phycisphaerales bacterium]